ncbi:MAG: GDP-mannose 4,6-dehydratase [Gammaproteobacteria bacterium]|nr:GDP-mannose 4,6-dehydratase [Gammaproteobacteria bacterium]
MSEATASARFWRDRNVLVTGCTGLLGSWLTRALVEAGAHVIGLVRDSTPDSALVRSGIIGRVTVAHGALEDFFAVNRVIAEYEIDAVFHLAAQAIVGVANRNPLSTFEANIRGTWHILEACRLNPTVKRIVVASSDKAYGDQDDLPYDETFPLQGRHPYDVSKSCADLIAATYHQTYGSPVAITRCGNLFGGGDLHFNRIIPGTIRSALQGERPVIRSDGSPLRDYVYVADAVDAYLRLARALDDPAVHGEAVNLGTARPLSVLEITNQILRLMGREDLAPLVLNEARAEIRHQYLSSDKARRILGWEPAASLDAALTETIAWYRKHLGVEPRA